MNLKQIITTGITHCRKFFFAFQMEYVETKAMLKTFRKLFNKKVLNANELVVSEQEEQEAYAQLWDLPKFLPFLFMSFLPIPGIFEVYLLLTFSLEKFLGIKTSLLPSQLKRVLEEI